MINRQPKKYNFFFLDRDGVINENKFVNNVEDFKFLPQSLQALRILEDMGKTVFIATNQGGIEAGYLTKETLDQIHRVMLEEIAEHGGKIKRIYYCPSIDDECYHRKPNPGMIIEALDTHNMRHYCESECCFIGDHLTDWQAAIAAGIDPIAVKSGRYWHQEAYKFLNEHEIPVHDSLYQAVLVHT